MVNRLEKRKFHRLEFPIAVIVEIVTGEKVTRNIPLPQVRSRNISRAGICLDTKTLEFDGINLLNGPPYARENRLSMSIELIPEEAPLCALGEVRWYNVFRDADAFMYQIGVEFTEIEGDGESRLVRFLKSRKTTKSFLRKLFE